MATEEDPPNPVPLAEPEGSAAPIATIPPGAEEGEAAAANDEADAGVGAATGDAALNPCGGEDAPAAEATAAVDGRGAGAGAGAGPSGSEPAILPPSMTHNISGTEGMSEDDIGAFMESLDEFTPTVRFFLFGVPHPHKKKTKLCPTRVLALVFECSARRPH